MRFTCWIIKATNTNSEYAIITAFPRHQMVSRTRLYLTFARTLCVLLDHTFTLSCTAAYRLEHFAAASQRNVTGIRKCGRCCLNTHSDTILLILSDYDRKFVLFSTIQRGISNNTQLYTLRITFFSDVTLRHCVITSSDAASYNRSTESSATPLRKPQNSPILCLVYRMFLITE